MDAFWQVVSDIPLELWNYDELEARLREKDVQASDLRAQVVELEQQLQQLAAESERFRRRVIQHEARPTREVAESLSHSHTRKPLAEATCEACDRTQMFCRCAG